MEADLIRTSKLGHSLSQISELTGLTIDEVKDSLGQATGLTSAHVGIIFEMNQRGLGLEQICQETCVELKVLKQFLPELIEESAETNALADRPPPTMTEETKEPPHKPQPTKTLPKPQHSRIPTFFYCCEQYTNALMKINLLTGKQSLLQKRNYKFKEGCRWSELDGGSLLITGGNPGLRDAVMLEAGTFAVSPVPPMHTARWSHAVVYHSQYVYVLGGINGSTMSECERYVCAESRWEVLPALPVAASQMSAVELDNSVYALGGFVVGGIFLDTVQKLSLDSLTWELMELKLPQPARLFPCFKTDMQVYLVIGMTLCSFTPLEVKPIKTVPQSIECCTSYYSRGTLYHELGIGIWSLAVGELTSP
jgi:hypothetical protein